MPGDDYESIMLSNKEKRILRRIMKQDKVPYDFCSETQRNAFVNNHLARILCESKVSPSGRASMDTSKPMYLQATDKAFRYFIYRKENYFKGKLPVVISIIALIFSLISLVHQFI